MENAIIPKLIASLVCLEQPMTPLKPPLPTFQAAPFSTYIDELDFSDIERSIIQDELSKNWADAIYTTQLHLGKTLHPCSGFGQLLVYNEESICKFEKKIEQEGYALYENMTDDIDRASASTIKEGLQWGWSYVQKYMAKNLIEGTFMGLINQDYFNQGAAFAFERMMHHQTRLNALRELGFHRELLCVKSKLKELSRLVQEQSEHLNLWRHRWQTAQKVAIFDYQMACQLSVYEDLYRSLPNDNLIDHTYNISRKYENLRHLIPELKTAYYNHMLEIKPKEKYNQKIEYFYNLALNWVNGLMAPLAETRDFYDVYQEAEQVSTGYYNQLLPTMKQALPFKTALKRYCKAIMIDNFIAAKWMSLTYKTSDSATSFDWLKEASVLENYKRSVDRLIKTQDQIDNILTALETINHHIYESFSADSSSTTIETLYNIYQKTNKYTSKLWNSRDTIDEQRINLRYGFLKRINTTVNESSRGLTERICNSMLNKTRRFMVEGKVFDDTKTYDHVQQELNGTHKNYNNLLAKLRTFHRKLVAHEILVEEDDSTLLPLCILDEYPYTESDYSVFYTQADYIDFVKNDSSAIAKRILIFLDIVRVNLEKNCLLSREPDVHAYWQRQLSEIKKFYACHNNLKALQAINKNLEAYPLSQKILADIQSNLSHISHYKIERLKENLVKYIISENNRVRPCDLDRLIKSTANKLQRYLSTGMILDKTPEFIDLYPIITAQVAHISRNVNDIVLQLTHQYPELIFDMKCIRIGDIDVNYLPKRKS